MEFDSQKFKKLTSSGGYATFGNLAPALNSQVNNPISVTNPANYGTSFNINLAFLYGGQGSNGRLGGGVPYSDINQSFMADLAAGDMYGNEPWPDYCQQWAAVNTDTFWPNTASANIGLGACCGGMCLYKNEKLTQGQHLLLNAGMRRFVSFPDTRVLKHLVDPTNAVDVYYRSYQRPVNSMTLPDPTNILKQSVANKTINNDKLMNTLLANPEYTSEFFSNLHLMQKNNKINFNGTVVGQYLKNNAQQFEIILGRKNEYFMQNYGYSPY